MPDICGRVTAVVVALALAAGQASLCTGWTAGNVARMACCADGDCPMCETGGRDATASPASGHAPADQCCIASERRTAPASSSFVLATAPLVLWSPASPELPGAGDAPHLWRTRAPSSAHVARFLLLSVLLV